MAKQKHTQGPWSPAAQKGKPGHCFQAQVFGPDGKSLACIEPTENAEEATANATLMACAPELLGALKDLIKACLSNKAGVDVLKTIKDGEKIIKKATK